MSTELPAPVAASIEATNAGDLAGFLASFTPDGVVDDWGREFVGPEAITGWSNNEYIGKNMSLEVTSVSGGGDQVVVIATVGGDGFNGPSTFTYDIEADADTGPARDAPGAKVARMTIRE